MSSDVQAKYGLYIDGELQNGTPTFEVYNPATNDTLTTVTEAGEDGVREATTSSRTAFEEWQTYSPGDRGEILRQIAAGIRDRSAELTKIETLEMGRPLSESKHNVRKAAEFFDYYAGLADKIEGKSISLGGSRHNTTVREPLGVTAHIVPWNASINLGSRSIAPALASGNTVVAKPSPETPVSLLTLAEIAVDAGLPPGVLNVVPGDGKRTGAALTASPKIDSLTFTGSRQTGKVVMKAAAENVTPVNLELGGNAANIIFDDANLDEALTGAMKAFRNVGQVCHSPTRIFIQEPIYEEFINSLTDRIDELTVGPGLENPDIGPLVSRPARDTIAEYVDNAIDNGADCRTGGTIPREDGNFYAPTLLTDVGDDDPISCEEVFGPVVKAYEFSTESEVVRRVNDTPFGLYGAVWTRSLDRAHSVTRAIDVGAITVNEYPATFIQVPFGGYKESGLGRSGGKQAIEHYTQKKNININFDSRLIR